MGDSISVLVEGGKATAAPPLGPALGPLGVNIGQVVGEINSKTSSFKGMQVPVTVNVGDDKSFDIVVGTPPAASLILKEAGLDKGSGRPNSEYLANLRIEHIIKVSKMKEDALTGADVKARVIEILGTCDSLGVKVEGKIGRETIKDVKAGVFDEKIKQEKVELSGDEVKAVEDERKSLLASLEKKKETLTALAKSILNQNKNSSNDKIRGKMFEAKIPITIINELAPAEDKSKDAGAAGDVKKKDDAKKSSKKK